MEGGIRPWQADEPLADLTLYADWDPMASALYSLRWHLLEFGTVPTWNYMFCGGRPELAVPSSWAWTWPSVFAYALPPNHAILAAWAVMSLVGFVSTRMLLRRWSGSSPGASVGAGLYVFSGLFAARFSAGHITFAFFHLLPLAMLLFEVAFDHALEGRDALGPHLASALVSFLGIWLAAYKLWPVLRWQIDAPRQGVRFESYSVLDVVRNTLTFIPDYLDPAGRQAWYDYPAWGYNAYVGPLPWLLALVSLAALRRPGRRAVGFGLLLIAVGIWLSLGNDHPLSPASLFRHLPVLSGVRAFNRYQVLIVFGLAILVAQAMALLASRISADGVRRSLLGLLAVGVLGPIGVQAGSLVWTIPWESNARIFARYGLEAPVSAPKLASVPPKGGEVRRIGHALSFLQRGYWIANCKSDLTLPGWEPRPAQDRPLPLSFPAPERLEALGPRSITLRYPAGLGGAVALNLRVLDGFALDVPTREAPDGRRIFAAADLADHRLTLSAEHPAPFQGAVASLAGGVAASVFFQHLRRRRPRMPRHGGSRNSAGRARGPRMVR